MLCMGYSASESWGIKGAPWNIFLEQHSLVAPNMITMMFQEYFRKIAARIRIALVAENSINYKS